MKKGLIVAIIAIMVLAMPFVLVSCSDNIECNGSEIINDANQINRKEPTCTDQGYIEYVCSKGGSSHFKFLDPTGHANIKWVTDVDATCTTDGVEHSECRDCGVKLETRVVKHEGHKAGSWVTDKAATCLVEGSKHTACLNCDLILETQVIPAKGHNISNVTWTTTVAPTCIDDGSQCKVCATCGDIAVVETIPALGHNVELFYQTVQSATCISEGLEDKNCLRCGAVCAQNIIPAKGHNYSWKTDIPATCTTNGQISNVCTRCRECAEVKTTFATGHNRTLYTAKPATCTADGVGYYRCSGCAERYEDAYIPAIGHKIVAGECVNGGCDVFERTIHVGYACFDALALPSATEFKVLSDESYQIEMPVIDGYFAIQHAVNRNRDIYITVTYLANGTQVVETAEDNFTISVGYGTAFDTIALPETVKGYTADGAEIVLNVSWNGDNFIPTNAGEQKVIGTLSLAEGVTGYYLNVATVEATVNVGDVIVDVDDINLGSIQYNVPFELLALPATVTAYTQQNRQVQVPVEWVIDSYNPLAVGKQNIIGYIQPLEGYYIQATSVIANVTVTRTVVSVDPVDFGVVIFGTDFAKLGLPETVTANTRDGAKITVNVIWEPTDYSSTTLGTQRISGLLVTLDGYEIGAVKASLTLTVKKQIVSVETVDLGDVAVGAEFAELGLPSTVKVMTNNGEEKNVYVIWDMDSYNADLEGNKTLTGTIVITSDLYAEDLTVTATYRSVV